jgi:hypothetical protein
MKSCYGVFKVESVSNQGLNVNQTAGDQTDSFGILKSNGVNVKSTARSLPVERGTVRTYLICVTILELNVYLIRAQVHERELKE